MSYILKSKFGELRLGIGTYLIGRTPLAHLHIPDDSVSRKHAEIIVNQQGVRLRDLGSANGVRLNGRRVTEEELRAGDRIHVGQHEIEVVAQTTRREAQSSSEAAPRLTVKQPARRVSDQESSDEGDSFRTQRTDALEMLAPAAETALSGGRPAMAERMLSSLLKGALKRAQLGERLPPERCSALASLALRLALALKKPDWIEFVFDLYASSKIECSSSLLTELDHAVREVPGVSKSAIRAYANVLRAQPPKSSARALVPTIEALEQNAGL
ncbi:MAG TPA: FHA domain-containing protein [Polyangiaceae bacterium]|nr:FHA domain-containing protein [Polyangiaceae bacterium]